VEDVALPVERVDVLDCEHDYSSPKYASFTR
jgi:hypothetical protein